MIAIIIGIVWGAVGIYLFAVTGKAKRELTLSDFIGPVVFWPVALVMLLFVFLLELIDKATDSIVIWRKR